MKVFLASFFLLIFSMQVIPVKEIGKLLYKGVMTEERHETECGDDMNDICCKVKQDDPLPLLNPIHNDWFHIFIPDTEVLSNLLVPDNLSKQYIPDILTPPPNAA